MAAIKEYKCPCCGGAVEFDSKIQKIKCPYCDTEFDTEAFTAHEEEVQNAKPDEMDWETTAGGAWEQGEESCAVTCATPAAERSSVMKTRRRPPARTAATRS